MKLILTKKHKQKTNTKPPSPGQGVIASGFVVHHCWLLSLWPSAAPSFMHTCDLPEGRNFTLYLSRTLHFAKHMASFRMGLKKHLNSTFGPEIACQVQFAPGGRDTGITRGRGLSLLILRPAFDFAAAFPGAVGQGETLLR